MLWLLLIFFLLSGCTDGPPQVCLDGCAQFRREADQAFQNDPAKNRVYDECLRRCSLVL